MSKLNVAIVGIVSLAAGLLLGLIIAMISGGSLAEITAERDRLASEAKDSEDELAQLREEVRKKEEREEEFRQVRKRLAAALNEQDTLLNAWMKSQALLGMILHHPTLPPLFLKKRFLDDFHADWYQPKGMMELMGGRWLLEEMVDQGLIDRSVLIDSTAPESSKWQTVKTWRVSGQKATEGFVVDSSIWRITWDTSGTVLMSIHRHNGEIVSFVSGEGRDSSLVRAPAGEYYLEIGSVDAAEIRVEQPK